MMNLDAILEKWHQRILDLRAIEGIITTPMFSRLWDDSTDDQRRTVSRLILLAETDKLREWCKTHPSIDLGEMNIRQLRTRARKAGVLNYSRKNKGELIISIKFREPENDKGRHGGANSVLQRAYGTDDSKDGTNKKHIPDS